MSDPIPSIQRDRRWPWMVIVWAALFGESARSATPALPENPDAAWEQIANRDGPPVPPAAWLERVPGPSDVSLFERTAATNALQLAGTCLTFAATFPEDARAEAARQRALIAFKLADALGLEAAGEPLTALKTDLAPLSEELNYLLDAAYALHLAELLDYEVNGVDLDVFAREVDPLMRNHAWRYDTGRMHLKLAQARIAAGNLDAGRTELERLINSEAEDEFQQIARVLVSQVNRVGKPLSLAFTDLNGRAVSLADYRGRVVLVDFWAMWCAPCLRALPELKQMYADVGRDDFEILGINFDGEPEALRSFVMERGLTWPQYPGGEPGENQLGEQFDIFQWPTVWLVDRRGVLRDINGERNTGEKIAQLLNEER